MVEGKAGEPDASTLHCVRCGYPLVGLAREGTCPECGTSVAEAISASAFFERDQSRKYWTRVGLRVVVWAFIAEAVWAAVVTVLMGGLLLPSFLGGFIEDWVRAVLYLNATMVAVLPMAVLAGTYFLYYGVTRVNKTGKAVLARTAVILIFAAFSVTALSAWVWVVAAPPYSPLLVISMLMGTLVDFPLLFWVLLSVATGLLVGVLVSAGERAGLAVGGWWRRMAYGAVVLLFGVGCLFHGSRVLFNLQILFWNGMPMNVALPIAPSWSYAEPPGSSRIDPREPAHARISNSQGFCQSDIGTAGVLRWTNVMAWWVVGYSTPSMSWAYSPMDEEYGALSVGLSKTSVAGPMGGGWLISGYTPPSSILPAFVLWPEILVVMVAFGASVYLWLFVVVQGRRVLRSITISAE